MVNVRLKLMFLAILEQNMCSEEDLHSCINEAVELEDKNISHSLLYEEAAERLASRF